MMRDAFRDRAIRKAIKRGNVTTVFQPTVMLSTTSYARIEALARLRSGETLLDASSFISAVDRDAAGTIVDATVVRAVGERIARAGARGPNRYTVNLSAHTLLDRDGTRAFQRALDAAPVDQGLLSFDVRADVVDADPSGVARALGLIGLGGCGFAVEAVSAPDALARIAELPVECVKVARPLVATATSDPVSLDRIARVTERAHDLGLIVTAVGAEDATTLAALGSVGVDHASGHVFGPPARDIGALPRLRSAGGVVPAGVSA